MAEFDYRAHGLEPPARRPPIPGGGPQTVAGILDAPLRERPDAEALVGRHDRYTYAELDREVNRAARVLRDLGAGPFTRVACSASNHPEVVIAFLATQRLGAIWVGVNRPLAPPEKAALLVDCGARIFLGDPEMAAQVEGLRAGLPALEHVIRLEPGKPDSAFRRALGGVGEPGRPEVEIDPFAPAAIAYTSGTTGLPKGAVHSQHNLLLPGAVSRALGTYPPGTRHGAVLPLTILNLMILGPLAAFQAGEACVCVDRIDPVGLAGFVRDERIGCFAGVPAIIHDLLTHPEVRPEDLATLDKPLIGGADVPEAFRELYRERFGSEVAIGYGMTEAPTAVTRAEGRAPEPGLCGAPLPQVRIRILSEDGRALPPREVGEICVAPAEEGPFAGVYTPMLGYWNRPEETASALAGGVLHSGDLGFLDEQGVLYIRGRIKELILRGGANVYPAEVERVLQEHPAVAAAACLGVPDERLGQRVVAAVQLEPGASVSEDELRAFCGERLARYKVPERIRTVEVMPRNAMNKIVKRELEPLFAGW